MCVCNRRGEGPREKEAEREREREGVEGKQREGAGCFGSVSLLSLLHSACTDLTEGEGNGEGTGCSLTPLQPIRCQHRKRRT